MDLVKYNDDQHDIDKKTFECELDKTTFNQ